MCMPPSGSSLGNWKLLIVTPGKPLNPFRVMFFESETLSKMVPSAVTRKLGVEITHSNSGSCNKKVAKDVNLGRLHRAFSMRISERTYASRFVIVKCPEVL